MVADVTPLRRRDMYLQLRESTIVTARREDFRIVHMSIQRNHVHLIVEAEHKESRSRGMQGFSISAAKRVNATITARTGIRRTGKVVPHPHRSPAPVGITSIGRRERAAGSGQRALASGHRRAATGHGCMDDRAGC